MTMDSKASQWPDLSFLAGGEDEDEFEPSIELPMQPWLHLLTPQELAWREKEILRGELCLAYKIPQQSLLCQAR